MERTKILRVLVLAFALLLIPSCAPTGNASPANWESIGMATYVTTIQRAGATCVIVRTMNNSGAAISCLK